MSSEDVVISVNGLGKMLPQYYELRGWDKDGQLKPETRARLKL